MSAKGKVILAMLIWGSISIFVRNIKMSSLELAGFRALIGSMVLIVVGLVIGQPFQKAQIKKMLSLLVISGVAISINWIFLFQSYRYTTVPIATLSYYFAPVMVILLSPFILKEKLTLLKGICVIVAMVGMVFILLSNQEVSPNGYQHLLGIGYGLMAAALYAAVMLMNKFIRGLSGFESTIIQLLSAAVVLLGYIFFFGEFALEEMNGFSWGLVAVLGVIHTGVAYLLFFSALPKLSSQSAALLSYVDPISAMVFSAVFLGEAMTVMQVFGGILVLGSTALCEYFTTREIEP